MHHDKPSSAAFAVSPIVTLYMIGMKQYIDLLHYYITGIQYDLRKYQYIAMFIMVVNIQSLHHTNDWTHITHFSFLRFIGASPTYM